MSILVPKPARPVAVALGGDGGRHVLAIVTCVFFSLSFENNVSRSEKTTVCADGSRSPLPFCLENGLLSCGRHDLLVPVVTASSQCLGTMRCPRWPCKLRGKGSSGRGVCTAAGAGLPEAGLPEVLLLCSCFCPGSQGALRWGSLTEALVSSNSFQSVPLGLLGEQSRRPQSELSCRCSWLSFLSLSHVAAVTPITVGRLTSQGMATLFHRYDVGLGFWKIPYVAGY